MYVWIQTSIWSNRFRTILLLVLFPIFLYWIVLIAFFLMSLWEFSDYNIAFQNSIILANQIFLILLPIVFVWFVISFLFYRQMIFAFSWAKPISRKEDPTIYNIVENLCISRWLPTPNIWIIEDNSLNAFATGWDSKNSWIVFSRWLINKLNKNEIEAVAWHELTHIMNKDSMLMIVVVVFIWIVATLWELLLRIALNSSNSNDSNNKKWWFILILIILWICFIILWYLMFPLIQLAISRRREYLADAGAVMLTKDKYAMISALEKISWDSWIESIKKHTVAALCIETPFSKKSEWFFSWIENLFSTHPKISDRIKALELY